MVSKNEPFVISASVNAELQKNRMANLHRPAGVEMDPRKQSTDISISDKNSKRIRQSTLLFNQYEQGNLSPVPYVGRQQKLFHNHNSKSASNLLPQLRNNDNDHPPLLTPPNGINSS